MPEATEPRQVASIEDAVEALALADVSFLALSARRAEPPAPGVVERVETADLAFRLASRMSEQGVDYRCELRVTLPDGEVNVDAVASYRASEPVALGGDALADFGDNVAIMTLFPYVREAAADLARRISYSVTLPVMPRGTLSFRGEQD